MRLSSHSLSELERLKELCWRWAQQKKGEKRKRKKSHFQSELKRKSPGRRERAEQSAKRAGLASPISQFSNCLGNNWWNGGSSEKPKLKFWPSPTLLWRLGLSEPEEFNAVQSQATSDSSLINCWAPAICFPWMPHKLDVCCKMLHLLEEL